MKTKKYLAALLALVMLLSILPMAAFAQERASSPCPDCGSYERTFHTVEFNVQYSENDSRYTTHHQYYTQTLERCPSCSWQGSLTTSAKVNKVHAVKRIVQVDSGSESGDEYVVLEHRCACGYVMKTETVWDYET